MCSNFDGFDCERQGFESTDTGVVKEYVSG